MGRWCTRQGRPWPRTARAKVRTAKGHGGGSWIRSSGTARDTRPSRHGGPAPRRRRDRGQRRRHRSSRTDHRQQPAARWPLSVGSRSDSTTLRKGIDARRVGGRCAALTMAGWRSRSLNGAPASIWSRRAVAVPAQPLSVMQPIKPGNSQGAGHQELCIASGRPVPAGRPHRPAAPRRPHPAFSKACSPAGTMGHAV